MTKAEKRKMCHGCRDEFYHAGNNPLGVKECWNLRTAKVVERVRVHRDECPPYRQAPIKVLSCYHRPPWYFLSPTHSGVVPPERARKGKLAGQAAEVHP